VGSLTLLEFESQVAEACLQSAVVVSMSRIAHGLTWVTLRANLLDGSFVDVFFNQVTEKTSFAWIRNGQRILGADNTKGWHWHPYGDEERHVVVIAPITLNEFLDKIVFVLNPRGMT
jgi:hypothetical protein